MNAPTAALLLLAYAVMLAYAYGPSTLRTVVQCYRAWTIKRNPKAIREQIRRHCRCYPPND